MWSFAIVSLVLSFEMVRGMKSTIRISIKIKNGRQRGYLQVDLPVNPSAPRKNGQFFSVYPLGYPSESVN